MNPLSIYLLALAGLFGLVIGSFLNVVIHRVPAGIPLTRASSCPRCDAPVRPWQNVPVVSWLALRGRCAACGLPISRRYPLVEAATAAAFVLVAWIALDADRAIAGVPATGAAVTVAAALLYFAAISIALTLIDLDVHRLPNAIVLPSYGVALGLFTLACLLGAPWVSLGRAAVGGAALFAFYLVLRSVRPGAMGGGDVKLAGVVGIYLGWLGWGPLVVGGFAAFVLGGVFGVALMISRRAGRSTAIPFGPWMIAGAWVGILVGVPLAEGYVGLLVP
ncbi:prepilin peptidase [Microbacterium sp. Sa4CUA7]|uniref:Prepilin peptidase n=1 Tax=Microbacterium pullorum TaxID=2762236 RepID=A0ABR8S3N8_9MICO|nr:A24 family peptidase [Microbacterium pullorum]MBD7958086.1 prepilin peptidase [Microbacterium pullorum]